MPFRKIMLGIAGTIGKSIPVNTLVSLTGQYNVFPFYHIVSDFSPIHIRHLYKVKKTHEFEKDLDFFLKNFQPKSLTDILKSSSPDVMGKKPGFFLSFDDGLREVYDIIAPILLRKGVPAAFFLNSAFVDNQDMFFRYKASLIVHHLNENPNELNNPLLKQWKNVFPSKLNITDCILSVRYEQKNQLDTLADILGIDFKEYLQNNAPYMGLEQIKSLHEKGFYFGGHSIDHPLYNEISLPQQIDQTSRSVSWVKHQLNIDYDIFAFPFTDVGVSSYFFKYFFEDNKFLTASFGTSGLKNDDFQNHFHRISMKSNGYDAATIIKSEYIYYILKAALGKNKIKRHG